MSDFEIHTPLGWNVRLSDERWRIISEIKHPALTGHRQEIVDTLTNPDEIRQSKADEKVFLFYKSYREQRWFCAVTKNDGDSGFLVTAYQTSAIKSGEIIWQK